ncbi:hypothetical protein [Brevibacillus sp. HB2.2]|uniref:hypothetical protein n=1 Tax=Brevibacillus sp. HB2.2 TaxID=2738846 RepID=UPI00156B07A2|nr:hypothetical protein [Brevibacillus sp. HB2.2]NRS51757.1 hypothetical protein [Brevibacillus sp. HB2.2]
MNKIKKLPSFFSQMDPLTQQQEIYDMVKILYKAEQNRQKHYFAEETTETGLWHFKHADIFNKLKKYLTLLTESFDDIIDRIQYLGMVKDNVLLLKNALNKDLYKYERRVCIAIHDAIHKARAEDLEANHLDALVFSFQILFQGDCTKFDFLQVDKRLRKSGISWIVGDVGEDYEYHIPGIDDKC